MTATNHALTGAFIGLASGNPWVALPASLASHFICDAIPHFGHERNDTRWLRSKIFKRLLLTDIVLCFVIAGAIAVRHPANWALAVTCAFVATSPDFYWIGKFKAALERRQLGSPKGFAYFAGIIQWFQKPIGSVVEIAWMLGMVVLLLPFLR